MIPMKMRCACFYLAWSLTALVPAGPVLAQSPDGTPVPARAPDAPGATPDALKFDRFIAEIPRRQAAIASVAMAQAKIAIHDAKRKTEDKLCQGSWTENGPVFHQQTQLSRDSHNWVFEALRHPRKASCAGVSRERFLAEMASHLPQWVQIIPAGYTTALTNHGPYLPRQSGALSSFASLAAPNP